MSARLRIYFLGYLCSTIGSGLIYPFLAVYVASIRGLGAGAASLVLGILALANIFGAILSGWLQSRFSTRAASAAGAVVQGCGYLLMGASASIWGCLSAAALIGLGSGLFDATTTPSIVTLSTPDARRKALSHKYWLNNIGLGMGALAGVALLSSPTTGRFALAYALKAAACLILMCVVVGSLSGYDPLDARLNVERGTTQQRRHHERGIWSAMRGSRALRMMLLIEFLLVLCGYSQYESVVPVILTSKLGEHPNFVSTQLVANTCAVILLQPLVTRWAARSPELRTLIWAGLIWGGAAVIGACAGIAHHQARSVVLIIFAVIFGLGECFFGASFQPLLARLSPASELTAYSAAASTFWGTAAVVGPPLGILLAASSAVLGVWLLLFIGAVTAVLLCRAIDPVGHGDAAADQVGGGSTMREHPVS